MIITMTEIEDINVDNIDESKVRLSNIIIEKIKPIMDSVLSKSSVDTNKYKRQLEFKNNEINTKKEKLRKDAQQLKIQEKTAILLNNVNKLIDLGVTKNTPFKNEIVILLKILPKLNDEKLSKHIDKTNRIIKKHSR